MPKKSSRADYAVVAIIIIAAFAVLGFYGTNFRYSEVKINQLTALATKQCRNVTAFEKVSVPYDVQVPYTVKVPYTEIEQKSQVLLDTGSFSIEGGDRYVYSTEIPESRDVIVSFRADEKLNLWVVGSDQFAKVERSGFKDEFDNPLVKRLDVEKATEGFRTVIWDVYYLDLKNNNPWEKVAIYSLKIEAKWQENVMKWRDETRYTTQKAYRQETRSKLVEKCE